MRARPAWLLALGCGGGGATPRPDLADAAGADMAARRDEGADPDAALLCAPYAAVCLDDLTSAQCNEFGTGWATVAKCSGAGERCWPAAGYCQKLCELVDGAEGCDFFAADLDKEGTEPVTLKLLAVAVSDIDAAVSIETADGPLGGFSVPGNGAAEFELPRRSFSGTGRGAAAYRVTSDFPIALWQLPTGERAADGTQLWSRLDTYEWVAEAPVPIAGGRSFVAFVAAEAGDLTVIPAASTLAGGDLPAAAAGETLSVSFAPLELVQIESDADLSGTRGSSGGVRPALFAGATCVGGGPDCVHLEEAFVTALNWLHVVSPPPPGWTERARIRNGQSYEVKLASPAVTLGPGEAVEIDVAEPLLVAGDFAYVQVVRWLASSDGTPAWAWSVPGYETINPYELWEDGIAFAAPDDLAIESVSLSRPWACEDAPIQLDGAEIESATLSVGPKDGPNAACHAMSEVDGGRHETDAWEGMLVGTRMGLPAAWTVGQRVTSGGGGL